ncbi:hypothetical protein [Streptomyces ipomoeae]|uniref:Integral membrane protein n=1 Tax=Streptomyces ipomoeae 91-03 TaxID=698759 RepID=L1KX02_9ACTN|nr:hypothetical protein [Streptomyces ipomoeae]EKX65094.1 hypothetical protein STRIP9103_08284 [Streptomyces ipomoeae 91-03]MDX2693842.1 hypothetical protein [Streptomyces ipomoeae]MDX2839671.1 hypothetical protein [Streptomyces ipomoeae]TQE39674.1 hypothetical protein Sipo7851_02970 [Streptomyces ipomoeae]
MSATQLAALARTADPRTMLRRFLAVDAVVTGVNGLAYLFASGPLGRFLGVDSGLLLGLGVFLTVYAAAVGLLASRERPPALPARAVIEANLAWSILSLVALALWLRPSTAGAVWTVLQAITVAGFAGAQFIAVRASRA